MIYLTEEQAQKIEEALDAVKQMCEVAHPQFNWGASFLQADGVALLNEAPQAATKALATIRAARAQEQAEQEPVALLQLAADALVYHTEQTRPIQNTIDVLAAITEFMEKQR